MLLVDTLLARDRQAGAAVAETTVPLQGPFIDPETGFLPEAFIELAAQTAAAASGFDASQDGSPGANGFLVGVDAFSWLGRARPGETVRIEVATTFTFGAVSILNAQIRGANSLLAQGDIRLWQETAQGGAPVVSPPPAVVVSLEQTLRQGLTVLPGRNNRQCVGHGSWTFAPESAVFAGHFPGNPILPAFLQLAMVRTAAQRVLGCSLLPVAAGRIKFSAFIRPLEQATVETTGHEEHGRLKTHFILLHHSNTVSKGALDFAVNRQ